MVNDHDFVSLWANQEDQISYVYIYDGLHIQDYSDNILVLTELFFYNSRLIICFPPSSSLALSVVSMVLLSPQKMAEIRFSA